MLKLSYLILLTLAFAAPALALPSNAPVPGGIAVINLGSSKQTAPSAHWGQQPLAVVRARGHWFALLGIPLDTLPGELTILISDVSASRTITVPILAKHYREQHLGIRDKRKVEPNSDDIVRIEREKTHTEVIKRSFSDDLPDTDFTAPVKGRLSSRFGLRRIFNGLSRNPHTGLDFSVPTGMPVRAPSGGVVADIGDYFFNGNTIFIEHGQGLISSYMHLSHINVRIGQRVGKGEVIGAVGATGRSTGPHLHWTVILNGTVVDPELFLVR